MSDREQLFSELERVWEEILKSLSMAGAGAEEFSRVVNLLSDFSLQLQDALEYALKNADASQRVALERLYNALTRESAKALCDKLHRYGFGLRGTEVHGRIYDSEKKSPKGLAYRILELTRMGKRDEVFFSLLNVFQGHPINPDLAKVFNPAYSDDLFKVFIYSFLSGLLGEGYRQSEEG
ncbi:MAG: hypothetical protein PWP60_268 [Candidatus Atribacteria bacterium]|jgi:hypothetical protein|uniref:DUF1641 domain-containing protein n=1 Tax=Thermatribacter velox TaxID=3039681 RepID=A0ABZ2Y956_9BACT|nr:hypothetical protein [Candidatus Atribacteria bacterium]